MIGFRPATLADLGTIRPVLPARFGRMVASQILAFPCWCVTVNGEAMALAGLAPAGEDTEAWFSVRDGAARLPGHVPMLRELFIRVAVLAETRPLIVRIDDGNAAGKRMARLIGFRPTGEMLTNTIRTWRSGPVREPH